MLHHSIIFNFMISDKLWDLLKQLRVMRNTSTCCVCIKETWIFLSISEPICRNTLTLCGIFLQFLPSFYWNLKVKVYVIVYCKIPGVSRCVGADVQIAGEGLSAVECRAVCWWLSSHFYTLFVFLKHICDLSLDCSLLNWMSCLGWITVWLPLIAFLL